MPNVTYLTHCTPQIEHSTMHFSERDITARQQNLVVYSSLAVALDPTNMPNTSDALRLADLLALAPFPEGF